MKPFFPLFLIAWLPLSAARVLAETIDTVAPTATPVAVSLPDAAAWQTHIKTLARYWLMPDAWGEPVGAFPTWRCADGHVYQGTACVGLEEIPDWMAGDLGRDFVRMQSRQTFAYGVIFNLTGDARALALHEAGVRFLKTVARDPKGGFYSYFENGVGGPAPAERSTQDLAYALVGLAMNAYLTHDPDTLQVIQDVQRFIYRQYWDDKRQELRWVNADGVFGKVSAQELVAQLDQLNAYLLLTWRVLPPADRTYWATVIRQTADVLMARYYDADAQRFWGSRGLPDSHDAVEGRHNDWGHTVKGFWMLFMAARGLGDETLAQTALDGMAHTLSRATLTADDGSAGRWRRSDGQPFVAWWEWAELDQAALTFSLGDRRFVPQVTATLNHWLTEETDVDVGEMKAPLKQHLWRNGFHSTEHALIGYLLSASLRGDDASLYFAPDAHAVDVPFTPYLYESAVVNRETLTRIDGRPLLRLTFSPPQWPSEISAGTR